MTIGTTTTRRRGIFAKGDPERDLPEGALPCRMCGQAVPDPAPGAVETITLPSPYNGRGVPMGSDIGIPTTRCPECVRRRDSARQLMEDHPRIARENGNVGVDRADAMLAIFEAIGDNRGRMLEPLLATDDGLRELLEAMTSFGAAASWSAGFARPGKCEARRWGHVTDAVRKEASNAHRDLVLRRMETPEPVAPPAHDGALAGCGFCGRGTLVVKPSKAVEAWGPLFRILPGVVGGSGPDRIPAHLCPDCRASLRTTGGGIGIRAVEHALLASRGYAPMESWRVELSGVRAFAALRPGTKPSAQRWAHLGQEQLARLDADLVSSPFVRRRAS